MAQLTLIPQTKSQQEKQRNQVLISIKKKRLALQKIVVRNEMLKVQLDMLKREYMVKIGSLVVKDNHLDLDIIRYRNIICLMHEGKTYQEASDELAKTYYAEQLEFEKEEESIKMAEEILAKGKKDQSDEVKTTLKKVWRRMISLFHPDLTQDTKERKRRENIMKQINLAYEEGDIARLEKIEREQVPIDETSIEGLEEVLVKIENEILAQENEYNEMKQSEWYKWNLKIRKTNKTISDIFANTEKQLLDDIVTKIRLKRELQKTIESLDKKPQI